MVKYAHIYGISICMQDALIYNHIDSNSMEATTVATMPLSPEYHLESELRKLLAHSGGSGGLFHQPPSLIKIKQLALSSAPQSSG